MATCKDCGCNEMDEWYMTTCHTVLDCVEAKKEAEELAALKLQLSEWRKCGEGLKADIQESLAQEGMGTGDAPASHYSPSYNRLLELLKEVK